MYYHVFESLLARINDVYSSAKEHLPMHTRLKQFSSQAIFGSSKCQFNLRMKLEGLSYSDPAGPSLQSISAREAMMCSSTLGRNWKGSPTLTQRGHHFRASLRASSFRISFWHCSRSLLDMFAHDNFVFLVAEEPEPRVASQACLVSCNVNRPYFR